MGWVVAVLAGLVVAATACGGDAPVATSSAEARAAARVGGGDSEAREAPRSLGVDPVTPIDLRRWPAATSGLTAVDPPEGFGGGREVVVGGLALYRPSASRARTTSVTGTVEAVVQRGEVVLLREAPSPIPRDGFVVAGAGPAADWLRAHLVTGALVSVEGDRLVARRGAVLHLAEVERAIEESRRRLNAASSVEAGVDRAQRARAEAQIKAAGEQVSVARGALSRAASLDARAAVGGDNARLRAEAEDLRARGLEQMGVALAHAVAASSMLTPSAGAEWRAAWFRPTDASQRAIREQLDVLAAGGLNTVIVEVLYDGRTIYPSRREYLLQHEAFRGGDPLVTLLDAARRLNLRVVAAVSVMRLGADPYHPILQKQPSWWAIDRSGGAKCAAEGDAVFLSPSSPEAMDWVLGNLREAATLYGFDGIVLTDVRLPVASEVGHEFDYSAAARQGFLKLAGEDPMQLSPGSGAAWDRWQQYRADQVTALMQGIRKELRRVKPEMRVGVAVADLTATRRHGLAQEWDLWVEAGLVDWVLLDPAPQEGASWLDRAREALAEAPAASLRPVVLRGPAVTDPNPLRLVDQLVAARALEAASGIVVGGADLDAATSRLLRYGPYRTAAEAPWER